MTYTESIQFLYDLRLFGLKLGLDNTRKLAARAGNPQDQLRFIHIAGTNGKGSVAAMLESIYRAAGLRVGLYTSPHLVSFRERIQVNRQPIREAEVVRLVAELSGTGVPPVHKPTSCTPMDPQTGSSDGTVDRNHERRQDACATFFEFVTVMALRYFAEQKCDMVIWETGLGGRLDATNIVVPLASVITNIEHDHQRWLGHDLKSIATEKAGIIKPGIPVITATGEPEALAVIQEKALASESPLTLVTPVHTTHFLLKEIRLPLPGWHQRMNAATALAAVQVLQSQLPVREEAIRSGLESVRWAGRLQLIDRGPACDTDLRPGWGKGESPKGSTGLRPVPQSIRRILLDGAHNAAGATALRAVLEEEFAGCRLTLILGILEDKDWALMCEVLAPVAERILCVPVKSERGAAPLQLAAACRLTNTTAAVTVVDSLATALEQSVGASLTVIAGSLYLVGEALELLERSTPFASDERELNEWSGSPKA